MNEDTKLTENNALRICPSCNFIVSQIEIEHARFDYECPRCREKHLSDFLPANRKRHKND